MHFSERFGIRCLVRNAVFHKKIVFPLKFNLACMCIYLLHSFFSRNVICSHSKQINLFEIPCSIALES